MQYRVVYSSEDAQYDSCVKLNETVDEFIKEGFKPIGSVQVVYENGNYSLFQAMIKE